MKSFQNADEVLEFAMDTEQRSINFFNNLADRSQSEKAATVLRDFARDAIHHKNELQDIRYQDIQWMAENKVQDMNAEDYQQTKEVNPEVAYSRALSVVHEREKMLYQLYNDLAKKMSGGNIQELFTNLAHDKEKNTNRLDEVYNELIKLEE